MIELAEMEEDKEEGVALWVMKPRRIDKQREEADAEEDATEGREKTRGVYFGEYRVRKDVRWLSAEEFCALSEEVRLPPLPHYLDIVDDTDMVIWPP